MENENQEGKTSQNSDLILVKNDKIQCSFYTFLKTGGPQPTDLNDMAIDNFFQGSYAKVWAMTKGFFCFFNSYKDGRITFEMISDSRYKGDEFLLSKYIASEYKKRVNVLSEAKCYEARHTISKGIIGFLIGPEELKLLPWYEARVEKAYKELSENPHFIHGGRI